MARHRSASDLPRDINAVVLKLLNLYTCCGDKKEDGQTGAVIRIVIHLGRGTGRSIKSFHLLFAFIGEKKSNYVTYMPLFLMWGRNEVFPIWPKGPEKQCKCGQTFDVLRFKDLWFVEDDA